MEKDTRTEPTVGDLLKRPNLIVAAFALAGTETNEDLKRQGLFPQIYCCPKCFQVHSSSTIADKHRYLVMR